MKMGAGIFWGLLLILIGIGIVIRVVFNVHFPIVKFIIAFFFIFIGIRMLIGNFNTWDNRGDDHTTVFSESKIEGVEEKFKEYNVIFGSSEIDLRNVDLSNGSKEIEINTVFGETEIKIDQSTPIRIKAEAVFASAKLPNGNAASFGTATYESENFEKDTNHIYIKSDVVFGNFVVRTY